VTNTEATYARWRALTRELIGGDEDLRRLQDLRYRYAAEVGRLLTRPGPDGRPVEGCVLYGVLSDGPGLLYVGQTTEAQRRLRDLAVGESHHLANTVPPEVWDRVIVVRWPDVLQQMQQADREAVTSLPLSVVGEGLERLLQADLNPLLNSRRRIRDGNWRERSTAHSRSRGAAAAQTVHPLHLQVRRVWWRLVSRPAVGSHHYQPDGRIVFPTQLLDGGLGS